MTALDDRPATVRQAPSYPPLPRMVPPEISPAPRPDPDELAAAIAETHRQVVAAMHGIPALSLAEIRRRETFGTYGSHYCYCSPMRAQMLGPVPYDVMPSRVFDLQSDWSSPLVMPSDRSYPPALLCWIVGLGVLAAFAMLMAILL